MTETRGKYALVNGLHMFYETHGDGNAGIPLVLLHGAMSTIGTDFGKVIPTFARTRRVIGLEQQGHGHTADIDRPFSNEQMAEDTVALLRQLDIANADFFGYSMGGGIALQIALRYPDLARKVVFAGGTSYSPGGFYPELLQGMDTMKPEDMTGTPWQQAYAKVAPNPDNWSSLVRKSTQRDLQWKGWSPEQLQSLNAPALLIIGDSDIVRPEHTVEMFRLLGGGVPGDLFGLPRAQLAILPGTTHATLVDKADWLVSMAEAFLC